MNAGLRWRSSIVVLQRHSRQLRLHSKFIVFRNDLTISARGFNIARTFFEWHFLALVQSLIFAERDKRLVFRLITVPLQLL